MLDVRNGTQLVLGNSLDRCQILKFAQKLKMDSDLDLNLKGNDLYENNMDANHINNIPF